MIDPDFYKSNDIHVHFPEGAIPKDGPSAGITVATAIVSALTGRAVYGDLAMTGEITLRGRVLPIGGLKEKSMAAYKAGITRVIIPADNEPDLYEVDPVVRQQVRFIPVRTLDEVIAAALEPVIEVKEPYRAVAAPAAEPEAELPASMGIRKNLKS
jgi:ATP-dependent Lon protease